MITTTITTTTIILMTTIITTIILTTTTTTTDTMTALVRSSSAQQLDAEERQRLHQRAAFRYTATLCGAGQVHAAVQLLLQEDGEKVVFRNPYVCGRILNALYHERHGVCWGVGGVFMWVDA